LEYTLTCREELYERICAHVVSAGENEAAGFLFAKTSRTENETRFIAREFWPVKEEHVLSRGKDHVSIESESYCRALQFADESNQSFCFFHSHPKGASDFSSRDNAEEPALFKTAFVRAPRALAHGSLVLPRNGEPFGRVWLDDDKSVALKRIRIIGLRFHFVDRVREEPPIPSFFDRQVRAFGEDIQRLLGRLHIGIVGCGGTGSAVFEQLVRLGVGQITIYDPQRFEKSNVNRLYGSTVDDEGNPKVEIMQRSWATVGLPASLRIFRSSIYHKDTALTLRDCDLIFGCTDDEFGRSILNQLALRYAIPVFDVGVKIDSDGGLIRSVTGRVTTLYPGAACLFCRDRITAQRVAEESRAFFNPEESESLVKEGYARELRLRDPAVISFTTAVASSAVTELLHRLTGFMGDQRQSTEIIHQFDQTELRRNAVPSSPDCQCANPSVLGTGDSRDYLGMLWGD
jgi:molybdopterin/thiamine biosynthesis adenylyltransferase/proteasome lid subunit RPN8/RPN11